MARGFGSTFGVGATDIIDTNFADNHTQMSWSLLAYRNGSGGAAFGRLFDRAHASGVGGRIFFYDGNGVSDYVLQVDWTGSRGQWLCTAPVTGSWHSVVITYDGSSTSNDPIIYLNGVSQSLTEVVTPVGSIETGTEDYYVGNRADGARGWDGMLAEFAHWNRVLSAGEVAGLAKGFSPLFYGHGLVYYAPLMGRYTTEWNRAANGGMTGSVTGTAAQPHPPILYPAQAWIRTKSLSPAFKAAWARGSNSVLMPGRV
jgi:hypothetical protein